VRFKHLETDNEGSKLTCVRNNIQIIKYEKVYHVKSDVCSVAEMNVTGPFGTDMNSVHPHCGEAGVVSSSTTLPWHLASSHPCAPNCKIFRTAIFI